MTNRETKPLTRADLVADLRQSVGLSGRDASRVLDSALRIICDVLAGEGQVVLPDLGRFMVKSTPSRPGRNPRTGEAADIPAKMRPILRASRSLRAKMMVRRGLIPEGDPSLQNQSSQKPSLPAAQVASGGPSDSSGSLSSVIAPAPAQTDDELDDEISRELDEDEENGFDDELDDGLEGEIDDPGQLGAPFGALDPKRR